MRGSPGIHEIAAGQLRGFVAAGKVREMAARAVSLIRGKALGRLCRGVRRRVWPRPQTTVIGTMAIIARSGAREKRHFSCAFYRKSGKGLGWC